MLQGIPIHGIIHSTFSPLRVVVVITGINQKQAMYAKQAIKFAGDIIAKAKIFSHNKSPRLAIAIGDDPLVQVTTPGTSIAGTLFVTMNPPRVTVTIKQGITCMEARHIERLIMRRINVPTVKASVSHIVDEVWLTIRIITPP